MFLFFILHNSHPYGFILPNKNPPALLCNTPKIILFPQMDMIFRAGADSRDQQQ